MTESAAKCIREEPRYRGIERFVRKVMLASPSIYDGDMELVKDAVKSGCVSAGTDVSMLEKEVAAYTGVENAVALSSGTAAVHLAVKLAAEKVYGSSTGISTPDGLGKGGCLYGKRVFCPDLTCAAAVNPVIYEGGEPVFIDASPVDWCMDPQVLEIAFERYPDVKIVIMVHLYGFPGQIKEIRKICKEHGALLIENAAESFGAAVDGKQTGSFGDYGVLSFHRSSIITGLTGGMLLAPDYYSAQKARMWSAQSRACAPWPQHEELGYDYGMSDVTAGIVRGQMKHLDEHMAKKKAIYERYLEKLDSSIICLNPAGVGTEPNYGFSCMTVESSIAFQETRSERGYTYEGRHGTAAPMEILEALEAFNAEGCPIWKPMHMQPIFRNHDQITLDGGRRAYREFYVDDYIVRGNESAYIFHSGLCLPSDIKMTEEEQDRVIDIVLASFDKWNLDREIWS